MQENINDSPSSREANEYQLADIQSAFKFNSIKERAFPATREEISSTLEDIQSAFKFNSIKERAFRLLTSGATPQQVAYAVGCTPAYISQLLADEEFSLSVALARSKYMQDKLERDQRMDDKKDNIEDQLLTKLEQLVPYMNKPQDIIQALRVANQLKRSPQAPLAQQEVSQTVRLSLPAHLLQKTKVQIQISPQNEILSTDDQTFLSPKIADLQKPQKPTLAQAKYSNDLDI